MSLEPGTSRADRSGSPRAVLHLVGRVTETVFSFLGPATAALAQQGARQTVILIDDPLHRHLLPKFHESVRLVLTDRHHVRGSRLRALLDAYCDTAVRARPSTAHLHGVMCLLLGVYASRWRGVRVPTYFSPHGSRLLGPLGGLGRALLWTLGPVFSGRTQTTIVNSSGADALTLRSVTRHPMHLIESPVGHSFFGEGATPSDHPQVMSSGRVPNPLGAAQYAQCAVVLADQVPGLKFIWTGVAEPESMARLKAAGVAVQDLCDDGERASRLAQSWIYIAPGGSLGFPVFMAEAMALGLPCVAWDTPHHRDIVEDGVTGFICRDMYEVLARVTELLESSSMRARIGAAARTSALVRFDGRRFLHSMLRLYDTDANADANLDASNVNPDAADTDAGLTLAPDDDSIGMPEGWTTSTLRPLTSRRSPEHDAVGPAHRPPSGALRDGLARIALPVAAAAAGIALLPATRSRRHRHDMIVSVLTPHEVSDLEGGFGLVSASRIEATLKAQRSGGTSVVAIGILDRVVGIAAIRWDGPEDAAIRARVPSCPEIHSVEVETTFRSTGVGSRLLAFCEGLASQRDFRFAGASVSLSNVHAYALYLRLGYVHPHIADLDAGTASTPARALHRFMIKALQ